MLAITRERVHLNRNYKLAARVEGRSSLARLGLIVHLTAPTIHAGFNGKITLEMINFGPFYLKMVPNQTPICQLIIEQLESEPTQDIATSFQGQTLPSGEKKVIAEAHHRLALY
jgi:dCTP deaminase